MSIAEKLELLVTMDPSQGVAGLQKLAASAEENSKSVESSLSRVGSAAMKLGVSGLAAGSFLTAMGDKEQQAAGQLEAAISAAGQSVDDYKGQLEAAVSSGEKFGHTAVETDQAMTTLVGSFGDTGKALDRMQLVEDLAAEKHISLASAAEIVAKAHGGAGRIFKEFNIQVQQNADGTKNYDQALDQLSQKVSGQASASMAGFTGWLKATGTAIEDNVAAFGEKYGPAIMAGSAAMTAFGGIASGVSSVMGKLAASHLAAGAAEEEEAIALNALTEEERANALAAIDASAAQGGFASAMQFGVAGAVTLGVFALANFLAGLDDVKVNIADFSAKSSTDLDKVAESFSGIAAHTGFGQASLKDFEAQLIAGDVPAALRFADALDRAKVNTDDFRKAIAAKQTGDVTSRADQDAYTKSLQDSSTALGGAAAAADTATSSVDQTDKAMQEAGKAADGFTGLIQDLATAMDKTYQASVAGAKVHKNYEASVDDLSASLKKNTFTLDDNTDKGRTNLDAVFKTGDAIAKLIEARFSETHSVSDATAVGTIYVQNLKDQLQAAGYNNDQIDQMIRTMKLTPTDISTSFSNNALEQQIVVGKYLAAIKDIPTGWQTIIESEINQGQLDVANAQLEWLSRSRTVPVSVDFHGGYVSIPSLGQAANIEFHGNAAGTDYFGGGWSWVGEKGPELMKLPTGTKIKSNEASMAMAGSSGAPSSVTFAPVINLSGGATYDDGQRLVNAFHNWLRSNPVPTLMKEAFR